LIPVPAKQPVSIRDRFLRGAIAIAANGIPIFNPQNNRGEISALIGELDEWGGHCGRSDDYHYHVAPLHLQEVLGIRLPIGYALDGYPIYGLTEPDGSIPVNLDAFNGHFTSKLGYHYHASKTYPYIQGGFHGRVVETEGQVDPQPRATSVRSALKALKDAEITGFVRKTTDGGSKLIYRLRGDERSVSWSAADGGYRFVFDNGKEGIQKEFYSPRAIEKNGKERQPEIPASTSPERRKGDERRPWIHSHATELDADHDNSVSLEEMIAEAERAFAGYDADRDGRLSSAEQGGAAPRTAMGGFVKQHADKIDADRDGMLTKDELFDLSCRMFGKEDRDGDGLIELNPPTRESPTANRLSGSEAVIKPQISDTVRLNVYADNWFMLYINGLPVAVDSIAFIPHNVVSVDVLPQYPMTIAVLAKDNANPTTGMEYGSSIGDGGFILKFSDGTVTDATWKAKCFFRGPIDRDSVTPKVVTEALPDRWWAVDFDDRSWNPAKEFPQNEVDPKQPFFDSDFAGAKFIWTEDLSLDNTVIFRTRIERPGWKPRWTTKPDLDIGNTPNR
jgi:hypothetical protein